MGLEVAVIVKTLASLNRNLVLYEWDSRGKTLKDFELLKSLDYGDA